MEHSENNENTVKQESCGCGCECSPRENDGAEVTESSTPRISYIPAVDIVDGESETLLVTDLPGVDEAGLDITVENDTLTIKAKPGEQSVDGKKLMYAEYGVGEYRRSFILSPDVNRDGIAASMKDGVLRVRLPKAVPEAKRTIAIESN